MASIIGTPGNDILSGTSGFDDIHDGDGNDQVGAGGGDDILFAGAGDDTLNGGTGTDRVLVYSYDQNNSLTTINLATGAITGPNVGNDTVTNVEIWEGAGAGDFSFIGSTGNDIIYANSFGRNSVSGGAGDDSISDEGHASTLDGGSGHNALTLYRDKVFDGHYTVDVYTPFTLSFTPNVNGTLPDGTSYSNFDWYNIRTGGGDDTLTFNQLIKRPSPGPYYTNWWNAEGGYDTAIIDLSNYTTQLSMNPASWGISITDNGITGNGPPPNPTNVISLEGVESIRIAGGSALDIFTGGAGSDVFTGNGGDDFLDGGGGADMARYSSLSGDYRVDKINSNTYKVTDLRAGSPDGADTVVNIQRLQWGDGSITVLSNSPPTVITHDSARIPGQSLALSSLFSVSDADGNAITRYQLWDATRDSNSGHFEVNGVAQAPGTVIDITASQLAQTTFVIGTAGDDLQIRAYDGALWSAADTAAWAPFKISIANIPPQVSAIGQQRATAGQTLALSSLFQVSDAEGDSITRYQLWDSTADPDSGHFTVNGQAQAAKTVIEITAAQLAQTSFVAGTVNDNLQIRAFDGYSWSAADNAPWSPFTIGPFANYAPGVLTSNRSIARSVTTPLSNLFSITDVENDAITKYQLWDSGRDPNSGHFVVNGVVQAAGTVIEVTAAQLGQTSFITGSLGDSLQIRAFDGIDWSAADTAAWAPFTVSVPDALPVVTTGNVTRAHLQSFALSSLFSVNDADGDAITKYQLWDSNRDPDSGYFTVNGAPQLASTIITITAAQLAQTAFVTGTVSDSLQIRAFDGIEWSAADNAAWAPFTVTVPANNAPVVTTGTVNAQHGRSLALSGLLSVTDADGDSMTRYQLWDSTRDPNSGYFMVGSVAYAAGTVIEITAAQLSQTSFVTGKVGDSLQIRAFDAIGWSAADNAAWAPFDVSVTSYTAPSLTTQDVNTTPGQTLALSSLFSVTDTDGDTMTKYQLWDSTADPNSGHFVVNGVAKPSNTVIDITAAQLAQTSFLTGTVGDSLQIRAFDGITWTAADTAAWAPFHINV